MDRIELHDVEYGDCTVLVGRDQSVLMVDCGSVSRYARRGEEAIFHRFDSIFARYAGAKSREFLLTHYHRDHMNGFLRKLKADPGYFDRVYIPALPTDAQGRSPVLELALFAHFFSVPQSDFAQVNTTCLTIFETLGDTVGPERICTLRADDSLLFDSCFYTVLSPEAESFPFDPLLLEAADEMNACLTPYPGCEAEFLGAKNAFIHLYTACQQDFSPSIRVSSDHKRARLASLSDCFSQLEALRSDLHRSPAAGDIREILNRPKIRTLYTETQNDLSLVFHNLRGRGSSGLDVLITGDVSAQVLERLSPKLFDGYYAVKAPHHGTESHFSSVLGGLTFPHLLISNGDYHAGGEISPRYIDMECVKHCANPGACPQYRETKSCCNRLQRCYEQPAGGALTLKCLSAPGNRRTPCNIYVFGRNGVLGCHCDR